MLKPRPLLEVNAQGLYCAAGDFYIDPWRKVARAVITHAHSDHAKPGSSHYLCSSEGLQVLRARMGKSAIIETLPYGHALTIGDVILSFHPAGHILGSAQVRIEYKGEIWVVTGDYKREADRVCTPFEPVKCHTLITESTFGLPIFNWPTSESVFESIHQWWQAQSALGLNCVISAYSLGKAQRLLSGLHPEMGPIYVHPAIQNMNDAYQRSGIRLPECKTLAEGTIRGAMIIAPPGTMDSEWGQSFGEVRTAFASGWMAVRNMRNRSLCNTRFVLSDHADWKGLLNSIQESEAQQVLVTHGYTQHLVRYLNENGIVARELKTEFEGEAEA